MATAASTSGKKPWRYYYVMAFPYSSATPSEKLLAMREATNAMEQKEEEYLHKIADRYAPPEKPAPPSPIPGYVRALLQQIALGVLVLMVAALIAVCHVDYSNAAEHIDQGLVYAAVGCIFAVFFVNVLGWAALSWHSRLGVSCFALFLVVLCVLFGFAIDQLVSLQFTQKSLQEDLEKSQRKFTARDVGQLVNGGPAPSLLHRFSLDTPTYFLQWLRSHCSFAANAKSASGEAGATEDVSAHEDHMVDSLEFYTGFWKPREQECVDSTLTTFRDIESAVQIALTALLVVMGIQLVLSGSLFLLDEAESASTSNETAAKGTRTKKQKKNTKAKKKANSRALAARTQSRPFASALRLLPFAIAISGLITCALSAGLFLSCDVAIAKAKYILTGIFIFGMISIVVGLLISCCHLEKTSFVKWSLVLLAIADVYAVTNCMTIQKQLHHGEAGATTTSTDRKDVILRSAYELVSNQTCAIITDWRAHTCEHKKTHFPHGNSSSVAITILDEKFDSVCQEELASLLLATLRTGISWLSGSVALNCLLLLILLAPSFQNCTSALARNFCNCICWGSSSSSTVANDSTATRLKHASLELQDARELYLSGVRIKDEAALEAETAVFNTEWASMTGHNAADITSVTAVFQSEFDAIVRSLVIRRLTVRCKMDVSLSVSKDGKQLFAKIFASDNLLMTTLCDMEYTLELADSLDPGPTFWQDKREIKNDLKVLDPHTIKQKLKLLAANNIISKKEAERFPNESLSRVSARIHALTRAARVTSGSLKCQNPHLPFAQYVPHTEFQFLYKKHPNQLEIPGNVRRSSVLRTIDCLRITRHLIEKELNVNQMVQNGLLTSFHCLHSASRFDFNSRTALASSWILFWRLQQLPGEFDPETHWFLNQLGRFYPFRQPLRSVRDYFGECIAFYFAWLAFYTQLLVAPALAAVVISLYCQDDPEFTISWSFYRSGKVSRTSFSISSVSFKLGLGVILWGTLFAKFWERKSIWYQLDWGTTNLDLDAQERAGFWGEMRRNPITNEVETYFSGRNRLVRQCGSLLLIVCLGIANLAVAIALILAQGYLSRWGLSLRLVVIASSSCQAFLIQWSGDFISSIAHRLSEFENYQSEADFQVSVIAKVFVLQLLNTYSGLFTLAFADLSWLEHVSLFNSLYQVYKQQITPEMNALVQLETLLLLIFLARIASHLLSIIHNFSLGQFAFANAAHAQKTTSATRSDGSAATATNSSSVEDENTLEPYRGSYEDYTQIVVQFGLVVMFSSVFPLAPLLAFVECMLEMRLDALDLCLFFQRPSPEAAKGIGPWSACIQILLKLSLVTIFGLVYFTSDNYSELTFVQRMSSFLASTLCCWLLSEILWLVVPSTSPQAQEVQARNEFLVERYFGDDRQSYDDDGGDGSGGSSAFTGKALGKSSFSLGGVLAKTQSELDEDGLQLESSLEHYRERIELLRRLNVALRKHDDLLPTEEATPAVQPSLPHVTASTPDELVAPYDDDEQEEEEMIVGYFKPVRTAAAPTKLSSVEQQSEQVQLEPTDPDAGEAAAVPIEQEEEEDDAVMVGTPVAQEVRESRVSISATTTNPLEPLTSRDRRPSKRRSFFARIAKRDSPWTSSNASSSSNRNLRSSSDSSEGLPPFTFSSRTAPKLSPSLLAALELGEAMPPPPPPPLIPVSAATPIASEILPGRGAAATTVSSPSLGLNIGIDIPRQYTTKELAGMDAINEATQRSRFDFNADEENQFKPRVQPPVPAKKAKKPSLFSRMLPRPSSSPSLSLGAQQLMPPESTRLLPSTTSHHRLELSGLEAVHEAARRNEFDFSSEEVHEM